MGFCIKLVAAGMLSLDHQDLCYQPAGDIQQHPVEQRMIGQVASVLQQLSRSVVILRVSGFQGGMEIRPEPHNSPSLPSKSRTSASFPRVPLSLTLSRVGQSMS